MGCILTGAGDICTGARLRYDRISSKYSGVEFRGKELEWIGESCPCLRMAIRRCWYWTELPFSPHAIPLLIVGSFVIASQ